MALAYMQCAVGRVVWALQATRVRPLPFLPSGFVSIHHRWLHRVGCPVMLYPNTAVSSDCTAMGLWFLQLIMYVPAVSCRCGVCPSVQSSTISCGPGLMSCQHTSRAAHITTWAYTPPTHP